MRDMIFSSTPLKNRHLGAEPLTKEEAKQIDLVFEESLGMAPDRCVPPVESSGLEPVFKQGNFLFT